MLNVRQILVSALGLFVLGVGLAGCGQRGPLYLPTDPAAANRATLPQVLTPRRSTTADAAAPAPAAAGSAPATGAQR
ncbi:MAG: hypothetical protein EOP81_13620 [Variovorax sp.]|nr:MAG: hypothetical protein EOP81_13620 [Variovorax sp.]